MNGKKVKLWKWILLQKYYIERESENGMNAIVCLLTIKIFPKHFYNTFSASPFKLKAHDK